MKDTVAIVGSHTRTRSDFDFTRTDCDVWLFNEARSLAESQKWAKKADAVFQMHDPVIWRNPANRNDPKHYDWLKTQTEAIVYMQDVYPEVPMSARYPLDEILAMLGATREEMGDHFLTSSVPQAMALAALFGYHKVEIYGVAMETQTEYQYQREGVAHWYGFLRGRGARVYFADQTFRAPLYGFEGYASIPEGCFEQRIEELVPLVESMGKEFHALKVTTDKEIEKMLDFDNSKVLMVAVQNLNAKGIAVGELDGALQENQRYKKKADTMKEQSGRYLFSRQEFESAFQGVVTRYEDVKAQINVIGGQLQLVQDSLLRAAKGSPKRQKFLDAYKALAGRWFMANNEAAILKGVGTENQKYLRQLDAAVRAAGGVKSEQVMLERVSNV